MSPLPKWDVPLIDPKTGLMSKVWRDWFEALQRAIEALEAS